MVLRKHWPSFLDNCDSEQTSAGTETDRRTQCNPEHIRNSIEYRLLRLRLSEEKSSCRHAGAETSARVAGAPGCAPSTRPHSTCCRRPQRALLARRPASSNHTHRNRNRNAFDEGFASLPSSSRRVCSLRPRTSPRSLLLSGLVDNDDAGVALTCARDLDARLRREKEEDAQSPRRIASSRKLTPSICVSPANDDGEDYDVDIARNRGVGGEWALEENADGVGNRVATRVLVDHSCLKIPGLTSVPETLAEHDARKPRAKNSSNRKSKVRNRTVSAAKRDGKSKLKGRVRTASSGDGTNRKMALSSTIARTAFQTSSKNCFLDPILHKVTVHIKNYKNPSEKVTLSMCYSSSMAGYNSNAISEDIQRLCKRKEALTREKASKVEQRLETQRKRKFILKDERYDEQERHVRRFNRTYEIDDLLTLTMNDATGQRAPMTVHELSSARVDRIRTRSRSIASVDRKEKWYKEIKQKFGNSQNEF